MIKEQCFYVHKMGFNNKIKIIMEFKFQKGKLQQIKIQIKLFTLNFI
jgi:hypothetical protein